MILRNCGVFLCACLLVYAVDLRGEAHVIRGVVTATDNTPLANAKVVLRSEETLQPEYGTFTERDGIFTLHDVVNGRYRLFVEKEGFANWYGQSRPNGPGLILALTNGSADRDVRIRMDRAASISGRVTDENGSPIAGAQVRIYMRWKFHDQVRFSVLSGSGHAFFETNDLGEYRAYGFEPGKYYVGVSYARNLVAPSKVLRVDQSNRVEQYLPTFFPGVLDPLAATAVEVGQNSDARGVDFTLLRQRTVRIRGQLAGCSAPSAAAVRINLQWRLMPGFPTLFAREGRVLDQERNFEITQVPRGSYQLSVLVRDRNQSSWTVTLLEVGTEDITDLVIECAPRVQVRGVVQIEGNVKLQDTAVSLQRSDGSGTGFAAMIKNDRTFAIADIPPDQYRLRVMPLREDAFMKSIRLGSEDVLENGVVIDSSVRESLVIVLSDKGASITGMVFDEDHQAVPRALVALIPRGRQTIRDDLYNATTTDENGSFQLKRLSPGDYELYSWNSTDNNAYRDDEFIAKYKERSKPIHLDEGTAVSISLTLLQ